MLGKATPGSDPLEQVRNAFLGKYNTSNVMNLTFIFDDNKSFIHPFVNFNWKW